ncbi:procollagen galactosyltransferase 2 isoform X1 [Acipenser ruthenus]|nr:procollagen galactosyltransferase 2 isoform X1 [Acipenser ruthenus]
MAAHTALTFGTIFTSLSVLLCGTSAELVTVVGEKVVPESALQKPKILIAIIARNSAHSLPFYLGCIERLDYPKDRLAIWAATDHNIDNTTALLREWLRNVQELYHYVEWRPMEEPQSYTDEMGPKHWTSSRFNHVMKLRQAALKAARQRWADYILFADADNLLTNRQVLNLMIAENRTIVAPMLDSRTLYSNFWCGITPQGFYKRTPDYLPIREWKKLGCFAVPMVHSTFLIHLQREATHSLAFHPPHPDYTWAFDDIMVFAFSVRQAGIQMYLSNREHYGYLTIPLKAQQTLQDEVDSFIHVQIEAMIDRPPIEPSQHLHLPPKRLDRMGFDEIFLINLKRRRDRRERTERSLEAQGISATVTDAVDGKALNTSQLQALGIEMLPGYEDPYSRRVLTRGEIGCFLSHYHTWKETVDRGLQSVLVLEDDVRFEPQFKKKMMLMMANVKGAQLDWDLIYVGRKRMQLERPEQAVAGVPNLVEADYSYWTLGYALSQQGALKLLRAEPLGKMLPVDEFLPVMFNKHPVKKYMEHFEPRELLAFSAEPLLLFPTHYTGDAGYVSDTETSTIWDNEGVETDWDRQHSQRSRKARQQGHISTAGQNHVDSPGATARDEL